MSSSYNFVGEDNLYYPEVATRPVSSMLPASSSLSRSVPGIPAATQQHQHQETQPKRWNMRWEQILYTPCSTLASPAGSIDGETEWIHFHFWYIWLLLSKHKLVSCFEQCFYIVKVRYFRIENGSILFCHQSTPQATLVGTALQLESRLRWDFDWQTNRPEPTKLKQQNLTELNKVQVQTFWSQY